ncbi:hypothetical protein [Bdellovibrio sp. NC01]|uniref:hypothetical protein n=1 Tax=Bdellovibrio sp. NC01 TaxID=2220073 RepID=UPI0011593E53|nr:hypothetical protein [Bdellovibrio sp. NC01]QDK39513.1 hypothetical protein DOE51_18875 [Bdellovibrio sp. NC01]
MNQLVLALSIYIVMMLGQFAHADAPACLTKPDSGLKGLAAFSKQTCQDTLKSKECQDLFAKMRANGEKPEEKALKCYDRSSITAFFEDDFDYRVGCAIGGWNFVKDTVVSLWDAAKGVGSAVNQVVIDAKAAKAENDICDADFSIKKNLFKIYNDSVPKLLQADVPADAMLKTLKCGNIKATLKMIALTKEQEANNNLMRKVLAKKPLTADEEELKAFNASKISKSNIDLIGLAKAKINEMGVKLECYNAQERAAMICEAVAEVASLAAGPAGAALKAAKAKNIFKIAGIAADAEKAAATAKTAETAATATRAVASTAADNAKLAAEATAKMKAGASQEEVLASVGKINDAADGGKARLALAEDTLKRPLSKEEQDWVLQAHNKASDKSYRLKKDGSADELSVADLKDKLKDRPKTLSASESRDLIENGILGSSSAATNPYLRLQAQKGIIAGLEKGSKDVVQDGFKAGQQYYKSITPQSLHADYRGASDIMEANTFGLNTKESADLFDKFLAVNKADVNSNYKSMIGSLSKEIKRLENVKTQDAEFNAYKIWRAKELRLELTERYYSKKYADKWGDIDIDKIGERETNIRQSLFADTKKAREYAQKRGWPTSGENN